jgi:TonB family protein
MKLSGKQTRLRLYPALLAFVLLLHTLVLVLEINLRSTTPEEVPDEPLTVRLLKDKLDQKRQIVQSEDPEIERVPVEDSSLSDKDRRFDRESIAKNIDTFKKAAKGGGESGGRKQVKPKPKEEVDLSDLGDTAANPFEEAAKNYAKAKKGEPGKVGQKEGDLNSEALVSSTNDYVEDVPLGDLTHLNTVEYKYYGFYHRIRQKLEQFWGRSIQEKAEQMSKNGRRLIASEEHITSLQITLNSEGKIIEIKIMGTSGVKELDDAAIESFNEAGPFPNPPQDLVVNDRVTLEWGFIVQT